MIELRGAIGMTPAYERMPFDPVQHRFSTAIIYVVDRRRGKRDVATIHFDENGRKKAFHINRQHVGAVCMTWLQQHEESGWPDAALDRDQQLGVFVNRLCDMIDTTDTAVHFFNYPVHLPWHGEGVLTVEVSA